MENCSGKVLVEFFGKMPYLISLNPQLLNNIAYVESFKHFPVQLFFLHVFCNSTKTRFLKKMSSGFQVYGGPADQPWIGSGDKDKQLA